MHINQYYSQWCTQFTPLYFYGYNDYTWNSPSVDMNGNYLPKFTQLDVSEIPQDTQFIIEITNNSDFDLYQAGDLQISFGGQLFALNHIMGPSDPYILGPGEYYDYTCTLSQSLWPNEFVLTSPNSSQDVDVTIRVVFPEIFTGWMYTQDGMRQYDSSLNEWTSY